MSDYRSRIEASVMKFHAKELRGQREPSRKNNAPERSVGIEVSKWARQNGFFLHEVEASIYDPNSGEARPELAKAEAGFPDRVGNTPTGLACYIELKAKDRRSTLSDTQRVFLERKIDQNCFAVVVDSDQRLAQYWKGFCSLKTEDQRKAYLYDCLPKIQPWKGKKQKSSRADDDFDL